MRTKRVRTAWVDTTTDSLAYCLLLVFCRGEKALWAHAEMCMTWATSLPADTVLVRTSRPFPDDPDTVRLLLRSRSFPLTSPDTPCTLQYALEHIATYGG
jgi:hypothetical protein